MSDNKVLKSYKDLQLTGATITPPGMFAGAVKLIENGSVQPALAQVFPLRDFSAAQKAFMAKKHIGNIVVTMD